MSAELHPSAASMSANTSVLLLITLWASVQEGEHFLQRYVVKYVVSYSCNCSIWVTSRVSTQSELGCGRKKYVNNRKTRLILCAVLWNQKHTSVQAQETKESLHLIEDKHHVKLLADVYACFYFCLSLTRTDFPSAETSGCGGCWQPPAAQTEDQALCVQQSDGLGVSLLLPPGHNLGQYT